MNLIDKNELDKLVGEPFEKFLSRLNLKCPKIVKAIPVEWFKKKIDWHLDNLFYGAEVYQWVLNRWYEDKEIWEKEK